MSQAGGRRSVTQFRRDPDKGRRNFIGITRNGQLLNDAALRERLGEVTQLTPLLQQIVQVGKRFRTGHVKAADVIGDFHAVAQHNVLSLAAGEMRGDLRHRFVRSAQRKSPAADAAEEMQFRCRQADLHFDLPRIIP